LVTLALAGLIAVCGCNKSTTGGPGADKDNKNKTTTDKIKDTARQAEDTFTLSLPTLSTSLKQGESKDATIGITRGKNFDEDVSLKFEDVPKGVTIEPAAPSIKHGDKDVKVTVKAADDAALGDFTVKVTGHPSKGADASGELKLTVKKK